MTPLTSYPPQLPPPSPPKPKRHRGFLIGGIVGVLAVVGLSAALMVAQSGDGEAATPTTHTPTTTARVAKINVDYTVEVVSEDYCSDFDDNGYSDLPYGEAEVFDGSGHLLGFGTMDDGVDSETSCTFRATFPVETSEDGMYRVTVGNNNRGFLNFTEADVTRGTLEVYATLGD